MSAAEKIGRLALRHEGSWWNAYYAMPDTMQGAILVAKIRFTAVDGKPARRDAFIALAREAIGDTSSSRRSARGRPGRKARRRRRNTRGPDMPDMLNDREKARAALVALRQREEQIAEQRRPFDEYHTRTVARYVAQQEQVEAERQEILEQLGPAVEIRGECEFCSAILLDGDLAHKSEDAGYLCEACAPTYGEALERIKETSPDAYDEPEDHALALAHVQGFIDGGGDPGAKLVSPL